jgi:ribonuclease HII
MRGLPPRAAVRPDPKLFRFDRSLGVRFVAGADEAGRGCLAGPLSPPPCCSTRSGCDPRTSARSRVSNDSKRQSPAARAELYPVILRLALKVCVVSRCAPGIDERGLHVTNLAALRDALLGVACDGSICLSDGFPRSARLDSSTAR